ncbi:MAG: hypothetical protein KDB00_04245 [Planctomycetales bacterium]|nr:hypothetical protein [Planctomycetales bacterium]
MPVNDFSASRRSFLAGSVAVAAASLSLPAQGAIVSSKSANIEIAPHQLMRVRLEIDVKGNVKISDNAISSKEARQTFPIVSQAVLDYEERMLMPSGADKKSEVVASERYYHTATNNSVLNKTSNEQTLRPSVRHAIVRRESLPETLYSPDNYFTHGELSLLKSPVSSVSVNLFLPGASVSQGDRFEISANALCSVLNLTSVDSGKVEGTVVEVSDEAVRFTLDGDIEGSVDGVSTHLRMIGKMTFDRNFKTCTWLAMAIHETREIGRAEPGFDVSATIRMVRRPMEAPVALPTAPAKIDFDKAPPASRLYVELQSRELRVGTMMDRSWRMIGDAPGSAVMRMIDNDISIAQCNLRPLVKLPEGKQWTLEGFEADVRQALGNQLGQLIEGDQRVSAQGLRVLRIVADGETQGVPIRWIMMHFSDDAGRRVQATFTMSGDKVESFAGSDAQFADSLRFLDPEDVHDGKADEEKAVAGESTPTLEIASRPASAKSDQPIAAERFSEEETVSSSDLK